MLDVLLITFPLTDLQVKLTKPDLYLIYDKILQ